MAGTIEQLFAPGEDWTDHGGVERSAHDPAEAGTYEQTGAIAVAAASGDYDPNDNAMLCDQQVAFGD